MSDVQKISKDIKEFLEEREWFEAKPGDIAKSISIEAAELLELFQWDDPTIEELKQDPEKLEKLKKELADILVYSIQFASMLDLCVEKIIAEKMEHNAKKWPVDMIKSDRDTYWKRKEEYRQKGL